MLKKANSILANITNFIIGFLAGSFIFLLFVKYSLVGSILFTLAIGFTINYLLGRVKDKKPHLKWFNQGLFYFNITLALLSMVSFILIALLANHSLS